ncbi:hypothetical protein PCASD_03396 [Puccinia coronata f. sp. avenae]|uniref:Uncharacterized protein n=1 Tax=Puccinia coronata f. sp. avenae TaxID=200324 RepID=A0A2N5VF13_9BASI|nr:hypothetical protein PCASD_17176 [Puccinia coronata f. sp. avenae]PLW48581.1 hypothetical protein PCASD_03396 [Puccinia coronata f. sp. avenae]
MDGTVLVCRPWTVQHGSHWDTSAGCQFASLQKVTLDKVWAVNGGWANASPGHPMRIVPGTLKCARGVLSESLLHGWIKSYGHYKFQHPVLFQLHNTITTTQLCDTLRSAHQQ